MDECAEDILQQLWRFAMQLERELSEEALELCWKRPQFEGRKNVTSSAEIINPNIINPNIINPNVENVKQELPSPKKQLAPPNDVEKIIYKNWQEAVLQCQACSLGQTETRIRQQAIVGYPSAEATVQVLLVCDAPTYEADQDSTPLDNNSLDYLRRWLEAIELSESYFLTNLVKCRTPGNRAAWPEELKACEGHLQQQLKNLKPKAILALGGSASRSLSRQRSDLNTLREANGGLFYSVEGIKIPLYVTYSVAEVLQNPNELRPPVWQDLKRLRAFLQS